MEGVISLLENCPALVELDLTGSAIAFSDLKGLSKCIIRLLYEHEPQLLRKQTLVIHTGFVPDPWPDLTMGK